MIEIALTIIAAVVIFYTVLVLAAVILKLGEWLVIAVLSPLFLVAWLRQRRLDRKAGL